MENIHIKYTGNIISNDINELLEILINLRNNLKDEYEFVIFIRNYYDGLNFTKN